MTKKEILSRFKVILGNDYYKAIAYLYDNVPENEFIREGIKKPDSKKESPIFKNSFLWNSFLIEENHLVSLANSDLFDQLLYFYFTTKGLESEVFLKKLCELFPEKLVSGVRLSQAFLSKGTLDILMKLKLDQDQKLGTKHKF